MDPVITGAAPGSHDPAGTTRRDDTGSWARPVDRLDAGGRTDVDARSVHGKRLSGPVQGFGKLWQKTYSVTLEGLDLAPEQAIAGWKQHYGEFWPKGNRFYAPLTGIQPGEVGVITGKAGGLTLSTGVLVLYSDERSFTFLTPEGHPFAGMITFSAHGTDAGTVAQVQLLIRAQDPLVEVGMAFGGHRKEDRIWQHTLTSLAQHFGVPEPIVETQIVCVDRKRQWRRFGNVKHDAAIYAATRPFRRRRTKVG